MNDLIQQVITWADDKGILAKSTPEKQFLKFMSELGEFCDELAKENYEDARIELGDVIVTIILYFELSNDYYKPIANVWNTETTTYIITKFPTYVYSRLDTAISDAIGMLAKHINSTPEECLKLALDKITKRQGSMINGVFVKQP